MKFLLSFIWYIASILIIYLALKLTKRYKFLQLDIIKIFKSLKTKRTNNISPIDGLFISLAAKIGVGSLAGVALAIYYGGIGTIFWIIVISLLVSINTYIECQLGIKYRVSNVYGYVGGPSYYIKKGLNNKYLAYVYGILVIITYSGLNLSIQANTIVSVTNYFNINTKYIIIILVIVTLLIVIKGIKGVINVNNKLVPLMLIIYFLLGLWVVINNYQMLGNLIINVIREAFNLRSIIPVFLIGMQRAIFMTEASIGTSAISASSCSDDADSQGLIEIFGIHIVTFLVCLTTFIIIVTSNYMGLEYTNVNGIEIVIYAFNYHFGYFGSTLLAIITIMFAFSTIISCYFFGENNLVLFSNGKIVNIIFKICFMIIIILACFIRTKVLWSLTDYFIAILAIINVYSILKIGIK